MLYRLGLMTIFLSSAFVGDSVIVPMMMVISGLLLMRLGRRGAHGKHTESERKSPEMARDKRRSDGQGGDGRNEYQLSA